MDGRPVLVSTAAEDPTADLVIAELNRRRVPVLRLDPGRDFPEEARLAAHMGPAGWSGTVGLRGRTVELDAVRALYHRRPTPYRARDATQTSRFTAQENRRGLGGVLGALPSCLYVSHPQAIARAEYKPAQLAAAAREGLPAPETLITNEPCAAREFAARQPTIYKPLHAAAYEVDGEPAGIWAAPVNADELDSAVSRAAHLFQARVPKVADVRAVAVGQRLHCVRIDAPRGVLDWRAAYAGLAYTRTTCPPQVRAALPRFLEHFGLSFGAFDFAVDEDGTWWFLECNPNGQWAWLEEATGEPLTASIADLLQNGWN
ncbi:ATP-grasp ribosomal peptide maturase [Streptomyces sp. ODS28]|uniref:ATP-grasp ribosomal peptide maturase n=1 Tax=Streptomyces sp. ODS28 TaxID=3136688 RepID=UPI0031E592B5